MRVWLALVPMTLASCARSQAGSEVSDGPGPVRPLAAYVAQRLAIVPTAYVRGGAADSLGWVRQFGVRTMARQLDSAIFAELDSRRLAEHWIMPRDLVRSYERNRTYATDPYQLALDQMRSRTFSMTTRIVDPLASQMRTLIALHEGLRYVFVPIEMQFVREGSSGAARAVLRAAVVDPRAAEATWLSDVRGDSSSVPAIALASLASRVADLFVSP